MDRHNKRPEWLLHWRCRREMQGREELMPLRCSSRRFETQLTGRVCLVRPPGALWATAWAVISLVSFGIFLTKCSYTKRANAVGVIVPQDGTVRIHSLARGTISNVHVAEGQRVRKGDLLFTVVDDRRSAGGAAHVTYHSIQKELIDVRKGSLKNGRALRISADTNDAATIAEKLSLNNRERNENARQIKVEEVRVDIARTSLERHVLLASKGYVSSAALAAVREELAAHEAQVLVLRRESIGLDRARVDLMADDRRRALALSADVLSQERELATLGKDEAIFDAEGNFAIAAAADGIITAITVREGSQLTDAPIAQLIPDSSELIAHVYVTSDAIGFAEAGQSVRLRMKAFPYQHYGQQEGSVIDVSESPVPSADLTGLSEVSGTSLYRIRVKLASHQVDSSVGKRRYKAGMLVDASIDIESRPLIHWILEPLYGVRRRIS